jgi:hypothetical protein
VLSRVTGTVYSDEELRRLFILRFARRLDQLGYVRFRHWRISGEQGRAGEHGVVWLRGEHLTVHSAEEPLVRYKVSHQRDQKGLRTVSEPRLRETQFRSPQLLLWEFGSEDWHLVLRLPECAPTADCRGSAALPPSGRGAGYWMSSVACCRADSGIVSPRAWAVLRLRIRSNRAGPSTGRSAGLAPLRILSMMVARLR